MKLRIMNKGITFLLILIVTLSAKGQTHVEFCKNFTNNIRTSNINFKKSYVTYKNNCFIQIMHISELSKDSNNDYYVMKKESLNSEYIESLATMTLKSYNVNGVSDVLIKNKFSTFKIILVSKDDSEIESSEYNIISLKKIYKKVTQNKSNKEIKTKVKQLENLQEKLLEFTIYDLEYGKVVGDLCVLIKGLNIELYINSFYKNKKGELFIKGKLKKIEGEWKIITKDNEKHSIDLNKRILYWY